MSREAFLRQLDNMLASTDLYDVITPDKVYQNVNLVGCNHAKKNDEGATLIIAELMFREIRETGRAQYSKPTTSVGAPIASSSPSAASAVNVGTVSGTDLQPDDFQPTLPPPT